MSRLARAAFAMLAGSGLVIGLNANPVAADPAGPSDFRSAVTSIDPAIDGLVVEVVGGDSFVHVVAPPGQAVAIPGYEGEPYVRIGPDGTVEVNDNSRSRYLNEDRYTRGVVIPDSASADATPRWVRVDGEGEFAWHDHRIHFMGGQRPDHREWTFDLVVGGTPVTVEGEMDLQPTPNPAAPLGVAIVALVGVVAATVVGRRRAMVPAVATVVAAAVALYVGWRQQTSVPLAVAGSQLVTVFLPAIGLVAAAGGLAGRLADRQLLGVIGTLGGVAATGGWVLSRLSVFSHAVLPTDLAPSADRLGTAAVAATVAGAAALTVWLVTPALPALDDEVLAGSELGEPVPVDQERRPRDHASSADAADSTT